MGTAALVRKNQLKSYFVLAFLISWAVFFIPLLFPITDTVSIIFLMAIGGSGPALAAMILSGLLEPGESEVRDSRRWYVFTFAMLVTGALMLLYYHISLSTITLPIAFLIIINSLIAAYIISGGLSRRRGLRRLLGKLYVWKTGIVPYLMALLLIPSLVALSLLMSSLKDSVTLGEILSGTSLGSFSTILMSFGYVTLVRGPLREEIGWRGFAVPRLQHLYSPLLGTFILSVIWTVWHLPLHLNGVYEGGINGFFERFYINIPLTFLLTWVYNHSRGSLLLTTLLHTSINSTFTVLVLPGVIAGSITTIFTILVNISAVLVIILDRMWRKLPGDHPAVHEYE